MEHLYSAAIAAAMVFATGADGASTLETQAAIYWQKSAKTG
ncbi:MAG: hypothetical protein ABJO01_03150 [Parasphingorhabdus sp.]